MPEHDFEGDELDAHLASGGRRHPFDDHMDTAPLWVKVVSRTGAVVAVVGWVLTALVLLGWEMTPVLQAMGFYMGFFGVLVAVVGMAFHPRRR